jgi:hypothetical protein
LSDEYVAPSINTALSSTRMLYDVGDATIGSGTTTVTFGSGASLPANVGNDRLVIGAETFFILARFGDPGDCPDRGGHRP